MQHWLFRFLPIQSGLFKTRCQRHLEHSGHWTFPSIQSPPNLYPIKLFNLFIASNVDGTKLPKSVQQRCINDWVIPLWTMWCSVGVWMCLLVHATHPCKLAFTYLSTVIRTWSSRWSVDQWIRLLILRSLQLMELTHWALSRHGWLTQTKLYTHRPCAAHTSSSLSIIRIYLYSSSSAIKPTVT